MCLEIAFLASEHWDRLDSSLLEWWGLTHSHDDVALMMSELSVSDEGNSKLSLRSISTDGLVTTIETTLDDSFVEQETPLLQPTPLTYLWNHTPCSMNMQSSELGENFDDLVGLYVRVVIISH